MTGNIAKSPAVQGSLKERPLPRLLQQLHRKKFTGLCVITDQTGDQSEVFMREGVLVHVGRPVDTDRLDNLLVEYGLVSAEVMAQACQQLTTGMRLGEILDRMGVLDQTKLAQVLKVQVLRKLTRLFFATDGSYAVYLDPHGYGEGSDLALMRVDPRIVIYPGIRAAYDLPRVTQELTRLLGQRFRLCQVSSGFIAALGIPAQDPTVESLRSRWLTLDTLDVGVARPLEVRSVVLALYYCDLLEREPIVEAAPNSAVPREVRFTQSSESGTALKLPGDAAATLPVRASVASSSATVRSNVPGETLRAIPANNRPSGSFAMPPNPVAGNASRTPPAPTAESLRASIQDMAQKLDRLNHFEALGISQKATADEVSVAFVRAARQFHPDRLTSAGLLDLQPLAERILARINEASMVLGDATRRSEYVASLSAGAQAVNASLPTVLEAENSFLKGEVFLKKGDYVKAVESFTLATQGNPSEPQYKAYLAWARFDDPRTRKETVARETLRIMEGVVQERPRFARGHYWIGLLWKFLNELGRAEKAFREAVAVDNSFIDASRELRLIEMRKSKPSAGRNDSPRGGLMGKWFKK